MALGNFGRMKSFGSVKHYIENRTTDFNKEVLDYLNQAKELFLDMTLRLSQREYKISDLEIIDAVHPGLNINPEALNKEAMYFGRASNFIDMMKYIPEQFYKSPDSGELKNLAEKLRTFYEDLVLWDSKTENYSGKKG